MRNIAVKLIGYAGFAYVILFIIALSYIKGEIVIPELLKAIFYCILFVASGVGIIFAKRTFFMATFYVYPFLAMDRVMRFYEILTAEKSGFTPEALRHHYLNVATVTLMAISFYSFIILFLSSAGTLKIFGISRKLYALRHSVAAVAVYILAFIVLYQFIEKVLSCYVVILEWFYRGSRWFSVYTNWLRYARKLWCSPTSQYKYINKIRRFYFTINQLSAKLLRVA